jgi:hypothetical protein
MSTNKTESNREGLPQSPERGIDVADTTPGKAGVGKMGTRTAPAEAVSDNPDAPKGKAWYRVKGPGGVFMNGVLLPAGAEIQMLRAEAQSIDEHVEEFTPTP